MNIKNIFKKQDASSPKKFNKTLFRHGGYSIAIIAVVVAAVILLNVLFSALSNRVNLTLDLSFTGENSISEENAEFLKSIDKEINITVCANAEDYVGGYMDYYAQNMFGVYDGAEFYEQTLKLLDLYASSNAKIKVEYLDLSSTAGTAITSEFPSIFYGDIIVRVSDSNGKASNKVVGFQDIYKIEDSSGSGYYYSITANKLETSLSSAINTCISGKTKKAAVISTYSDNEIFDTLFGSQLKLNGFEITEINDNIISQIGDDIEQLYLVAPTKDMLAEELAVINNWLYNGGNRGRSLVFIPNTNVTNIPKILEFLKEWGITYSDGILYETNSSNHYQGSPTTLFAFNNESDLKIANKDKNYLGGHNLPMEAAYETFSTKETKVIISTADTVVAAPLGINSDWKPDDSYTKKSYANIIITEDSDVVGDGIKSSYVSAFSSVEFIYSQWAQLSQLGNMEAAINTATFAAGIENDSQLLFLDKTVTTESFADKVNEADALSIQIIFMITIPLALIVAGFVVWIRRKNR